MSFDAQGADKLVLARADLAHAGYFDEFGRHLTVGHVRAHVHDLLGSDVHAAATESAKHADDPEHQAHQDLTAAFGARMKGVWTIDRFDAPVEWYAAKYLGVKEDELDEFHKLSPEVKAAAIAALHKNHRPVSSQFEESFENLFLTAGVTALWNQAIASQSANSGAAPAGADAYFNNTQAMIGVGDSATAASAGQTDLQAATNKTYVGMDATYPTISTNQINFRATFGSASANYAWAEFVVNNRNGSNSTTTGGTTLDRVVSSQGTKASGQTWQPTMSLSIS